MFANNDPSDSELDTFPPHIRLHQQYQARLTAQQQHVPSNPVHSDPVESKDVRLSEERKQTHAGDLIGKCIILMP